MFSAWIESADGEQRWEIGALCTFGRPSVTGPANTIQIDLPFVSRRHAFIHRQKELEFIILDAGSADGTYVNGTLILAPTPLFDTDRITIGDLNFLFRQPGSIRGQTEAEKPQVTVFRFRKQLRWLFQVDHARYTPFTTQTAPLDVARTVWPWYREARGIVEGHGGLVNQFLGDGILGSFPENTPAENLPRAIGELRALPGAASLSIRIALHFGEVAVAGALHSQEMMGESMNYLARMEKLARDLGHDCMLSVPAFDRLKEWFPHAEQTKEANLAGFEGPHRFYKV